MFNAAAAVALFPALDAPHAFKSPYYLVEVKTPDGWQPSFVNLNPARTNGSGQLDAPGRNYFPGDINAFSCEDFRIGGEAITTPEAGRFAFGTGAGGGFKFN